MTDGKEIKALINEYKNLYQRHYLAYKVSYWNFDSETIRIIEWL